MEDIPDYIKSNLLCFIFAASNLQIKVCHGTPRKEGGKTSWQSSEKGSFIFNGEIQDHVNRQAAGGHWKLTLWLFFLNFYALKGNLFSHYCPLTRIVYLFSLQIFLVVVGTIRPTHSFLTALFTFNYYNIFTFSYTHNSIYTLDLL